MRYLSLILLVLSFSVSAKRFSNQYLEFELPNSWECILEGAEWVCQSTNESRKKEAIIIFAAKNRGPKDSIEEYQAYLKKAKTFTLPGGQTLVSEPKYANPVEVNGHKWIDSLHMASEIPGFYTRYIATVKEDLGVVVTFSVARDSYGTYKPVFDKMVASIRVFRQVAKNVKVAINETGSGYGAGDSVFVPEDASELLPAKNKVEKKKNKEAGSSSGSDFIIIVVVVAAVLYFIIRRKKPSDD